MRLPRAFARQQRRSPGDVCDLVLAEQKADALADLVGDAAAALDHGGKIRAHLAGADPDLLGTVKRLEDLRRAEQGLGRNTSPVEADPTEALALDARGLEAELRAADRRDVAARARADHHDVV